MLGERNLALQLLPVGCFDELFDYVVDRALQDFVKFVDGQINHVRWNSVEWL